MPLMFYHIDKLVMLVKLGAIFGGSRLETSQSFALATRFWDFTSHV